MCQGVVNDSGCPLQWTEHSANSKISTARPLIHIAALYLTVVAVLWCVPSCLYHRISETGQAVVLTLVDTPSAELQNLAEPHLSTDPNSQSTTQNLSLTSSSVPDADATITLPSAQPNPQLSSLPTILLPPEFNRTEEDGHEGILEDTEAVIVVRAEQRPIENIVYQVESVDSNEKLFKDIEESFTGSGELDEGAARAKLVSGSAEEAAVPILDGLVASGGSEHHEEIPSFSEWAQKRLEEAEKKKTHPNASIQNPGGPGRGLSGMKMRSKNYASPDCGAKIVAVNPEARSARSVLVHTRDEYMLNTCTSRIWFVVELCEAIQAKKIELANFELFSSSPKEFSVFVNDRFPTREWSAVGHFTAKDERDIQSFSLHPHLFGKFIKIELHSHYGSEHFCPISLFRAYGTSEFEVLETETEVQETAKNDDDHDHDDDDDDDDDDDEDATAAAAAVAVAVAVAVDDDDDNDDEEGSTVGGDSSRNLFGSASDVVIRIVKKAAEVFVKAGDSVTNNITNIQKSYENNINQSLDSCTTPRYTILCSNCTDQHFADVFQLLSCRASHLDSILKIAFINETLHRSEICGLHGINLKKSAGLRILKKKSLKNFSLARNSSTNFLVSLFSSEYIVALCNVLATKECKLVLNSNYRRLSNHLIINSMSFDVYSSKSEMPDISGTVARGSVTDAMSNRQIDSSVEQETLTVETKASQAVYTSETIKTTEIVASQIKPTKTLGKEDVKKESSMPILEPSKDHTEETIHAEFMTTPSPLLNSATATSPIIEEPLPVGTSAESVSPIIFSQIVNIESQDDVGGESVLSMKIEEKKEGARIDTGNRIKVEDMEEKLKEKESEETKFTIQDQLSLDTLLLDLKDLESDPSIHGQVNSASIVAQPAASSTPQQKESVFLRLSNRIKALEQNMSLSSQYLEELSRRYKKQVEEMQRSLERATAAMGEELKKSEERELKRQEEVIGLRGEISSLAESMEQLIYDRNSWRSKLSTFGQHIALIFIEILVLIFIIFYCRRSTYNLDDLSISEKIVLNKEILRRKSAESMDSDLLKKTKTRRPSEIALRITGTYQDLMIDNDRSESRREKKKKRKRDSLMRLTTNVDTRRDISTKIMPSRRASSVDCSKLRESEVSQSTKRPDSAPDCSRSWLEAPLSLKNANEKIQKYDRIAIEEIDGKALPEFIPDDFVDQYRHPIHVNGGEGSSKNSFRGLGILKSAKVNSPSFMKTALRARSKREYKSNNSSYSVPLNAENWQYYSGSSRSGKDSPSSLNVSLDSSNINSYNGDSTTNGHYGIIDDSGSVNITTPRPGKNVKKEGGLRKMPASVESYSIM